MWLITGTIPDNNFPLSIDAIKAESIVEGNDIILPNGYKIPVARGTAALAATALLACHALNVSAPRLLLTGDQGQGTGSQMAYNWLATNLADLAKSQAPLKGITFHYFYPDLDGHNRVLMAVDGLSQRPTLVADAGFMYVAKMSGYAKSYDLFTPDIGELAFMADEKAPHPFYTRGFLLARDDDVPELLERALKNGNCPANMIIKGATDYILCDRQLKATVREPSEPAMECIGGTGDIVTGLATAYLIAGYPICKSALWGARAARFLAQACKPTPATQASELIARIPEVLNGEKRRIEEGY